MILHVFAGPCIIEMRQAAMWVVTSHSQKRVWFPTLSGPLGTVVEVLHQLSSLINLTCLKICSLQTERISLRTLWIFKAVSIWPMSRLFHMRVCSVCTGLPRTSVRLPITKTQYTELWEIDRERVNVIDGNERQRESYSNRARWQRKKREERVCGCMCVFFWGGEREREDRRVWAERIGKREERG